MWEMFHVHYLPKPLPLKIIKIEIAKLVYVCASSMAARNPVSHNDIYFTCCFVESYTAMFAIVA